MPSHGDYGCPELRASCSENEITLEGENCLDASSNNEVAIGDEEFWNPVSHTRMDYLKKKSPASDGSQV